MQAVEALTRLIKTTDDAVRGFKDEVPEENKSDEDRDWVTQTEVAVAVAQAMLNTALPVARFRAHVTIDKIGPSSKLGLGDFTVCGVSIPSIKNGLIGLSHEGVEVHVSLWEQKAAGADMLSGYQGHSKSRNFRLWLADIDAFEGTPE